MKLQVYIVFSLGILFSLSSYAQSTGRQHSPLYNLNGGKYKSSGWMFAPGITYMLPGNTDYPDTRTARVGELVDTLYSGDFAKNGKIGIYAEVGRFHLSDKILVLDCYDYGIGYKWLRGEENFEGVAQVDNVLVPVSNTGTFSDHSIHAFFNASDIFQISDRTFIQNSLGVNIDYQLAKNRSQEGEFGPFIQNFPPDLMGQIHYKLGFGFKATSRLFFVPSIETPILTVAPFDDGKSTMTYFSSRYRPLIFSLRVMILDRRPTKDCVGKPDGKVGDQLWDKKMNKKYRR